MPAPTYEDRVLGCLLGTMAGDAFATLYAAGDDARQAFEDPSAVAVSDATHLTLYTVDALTEALEWANDGVAADEIACVWLAYLRWLGRQGEHLPSSAPSQPGRWLDRQEDLLAVHDPDPDTVGALLTGEMGTRSRPLNPAAEGPGALMRSAPFGLVPRIPAAMVERLTVDAAALTHGSPAARGAAARHSGLVRSLVIENLTLEDTLRADREAEERLSAAAHDDARALARKAPPREASGTMAVGEGSSTTAPATLEAALQAVQESAGTAPRGHLEAALGHAAAAGRPDASGRVAASVAGGLVGALHGTSALPPAYLTADGLPGVVRSMARTLLTATTGT
jgi:ADP-ribosylglycohydrolase